jgi:hypothetical protein
VSNLMFDPEAIGRWNSLRASSGSYERAVRRAVGAILARLEAAPGEHRIGATQFQTTPTMWARIAEVDDGADWIVIWTVDDDQTIRILRIEPAPSL